MSFERMDRWLQLRDNCKVVSAEFHEGDMEISIHVGDKIY